MNFRKLAAIAGVSMLVFAACSSKTPAGSGAAPSGGSGAALTASTPAPAADTSKGKVKIGRASCRERVFITV